MKLSFLAAAAAPAFVAVSVYAAPIDPALPGNTSYDGWAELTDANYDQSDYGGSWPGGDWGQTIVSNQSGSGDAELAKLTGVGYLASDGIYVAGSAPLPNAFGGMFSIADATPLSNAANVVFQIDISNSYGGFDFHNGVLPTLTYTTSNGDVTLAASLSGIVDHGVGPNDPTTGGTFDRNTYLLQWDLSSVVDEITALQIDLSAVQHTFIFGLQLDQADQFVPVDDGLFIPEPTSLTLLGGFGVLMAMRKR